MGTIKTISTSDTSVKNHTVGKWPSQNPTGQINPEKFFKYSVVGRDMGILQDFAVALKCGYNRKEYGSQEQNSQYNRRGKENTVPGRTFRLLALIPTSFIITAPPCVFRMLCWIALRIRIINRSTMPTAVPKPCRPSLKPTLYSRYTMVSVVNPGPPSVMTEI